MRPDRAVNHPEIAPQPLTKPLTTKFYRLSKTNLAQDRIHPGEKDDNVEYA